MRDRVRSFHSCQPFGPTELSCSFFCIWLNPLTAPFCALLYQERFGEPESGQIYFSGMMGLANGEADGAAGFFFRGHEFTDGVEDGAELLVVTAFHLFEAAG